MSIIKMDSLYKNKYGNILPTVLYKQKHMVPVMQQRAFQMSRLHQKNRSARENLLVNHFQAQDTQPSSSLPPDTWFPRLEKNG
jgi:hypothetical protein